MNDRLSNSRKYMVEGTTLYRWCINRGVPYSAAIQMLGRGKTIEETILRLNQNYYRTDLLLQNKLIPIIYDYAKEYPVASRDRRLEIRNEFTSMFLSLHNFETHWERIVSGEYWYYSSDVTEKWKPCTRDHSIQISDQGKFRRLLSNGSYRKIKIFLVLKKNKSGNKDRRFLAISVGNCRATRASRLIAEAWVPRQPGESVVHQIDNDYTNILPSNLKWMSKSTHGMTTGYSTKRSKPVKLLDDNRRIIEKFESVREAAKELGISYQTVSNYCKNTTKKKMFNLKFDTNNAFINSELFKKKYVNQVQS